MIIDSYACLSSRLPNPCFIALVGIFSSESTRAEMSQPDRSKTSVILIAGAWHNTTHTASAIQLLQSAGYTAIGCHPYARNRISYEGDSQFIRSTINTELQKGQQIVLIYHSLAARAGCEAVNQILAADPSSKDKFVHNIWVAAFLTTNPADMPALFDGKVKMDMVTGLASVTDPASFFFNDMDAIAAKPFVDAVEPILNLYPPLELSSELYKKLPMTYIHCQDDNTTSPKLQEREAAENGMSVVSIKSAHVPFVSQPEAFVDTVVRIIS